MSVKQRIALLESATRVPEPNTDPKTDAAIRKAVGAFFDHQQFGTPIPDDVDTYWLDEVARCIEMV